MKLFKSFWFYLLISILVIAAGIFLYFQHHKKTKANNKILQETYIVKKQPYEKTLYFSGTIDPIHVVPVYSPTEGLIKKMSFTYGHAVEKGHLLEIIRSDKQKQDMESSLTEYIKTKHDNNNAKAKWQISEKLFNNDLISRDERDQDRDNYYLGRISLDQTRNKLSSEINQSHQYSKAQVEALFQKINSLKIEDFDKIQQTISALHSAATINVIAPIGGVALFDGDGGNDSKKVDPGSQVKKDQILLKIGDLSGLKIKLTINEYEINHIKEGQKAIITSDAFPEFTLTGKVEAVSDQATNSESVPNFSATVVIPNITPEQQQKIHVGMNAKVAIKLSTEPQIIIPLNAVEQKNGSSYVQLIDPQTSTKSEHPIITGETTEQGVVVKSGLNDGDKIAITD